MSLAMEKQLPPECVSNTPRGFLYLSAGIAVIEHERLLSSPPPPPPPPPQKGKETTGA